MQRFFLACRLIAILAIIVTISLLINLASLIATHSGLEVTDTFAQTLGDLRYSTRSKKNYYYQRYYQQLRHSKWTHVVLLNKWTLMERFYAWYNVVSNMLFWRCAGKDATR
jgi:hypothetical protein